jgi:hypothetical protein
LAHLVSASTQLINITKREVTNGQRFYARSPGWPDLQRFDCSLDPLGGIAGEVMRERERAEPQKILRVERI